MRGLPQKQNARRAYKIRLCGHLRRYKKIVKKTYIIYNKEHMYLIDYARQACANANVPEDISPIRGGTDGCKLSFKGLPCPNLGTGGHGYHGPLEHVTIEGMEAAVRVIVELVKIFANE